MAFRIVDTRTPTNVLEVKDESHTFAVGAAGTIVIFRIDKRPILNELGTGMGTLGDTSFEWDTGTIFTTEVLFDKSKVGNLEEAADNLATGEYAIDYLNGIFIGKKATSGTSDRCSYLSEQLNAEVTVDATIGDLDLKKINSNNVSTNIGNADTGTLRVAIVSDDVNLSLINSNITNVVDAIDTSEKVVKTKEQEPVFFHFNSIVLADVTNGADNTYEYYIDMDTYRFLNLQLELNGGSGSVTVTIEGTLQDDGTMPENCIYQDVSMIYGQANWTSSDVLKDIYGSFGAFKYIKIKVVANTSGSNDADWMILARKMY